MESPKCCLLIGREVTQKISKGGTITTLHLTNTAFFISNDTGLVHLGSSKSVVPSMEGSNRLAHQEMKLSNRDKVP